MNIIETFEKLTNLQKVLVTIIVATVIYSASSGISYTIFGQLLYKGSMAETKLTSLPTTEGNIDPEGTGPKTEECVLSGSMHTKVAKDIWSKKRPLAVMIENHQESRPQSGLTSADIVYEAVAEGGITRFMAVFYCNQSDIQIGPVRSARTYYLDWLSEYDALYAHVGGANTPGPADALGQIIKYQVKNLNQFSIGFPVFWRDYQRLGHSVATEHTMYSTTQKLWEVGAKKGWTNVDEDGIAWDKNFIPWKFKDPAPSGAGQVVDIKVNFWANQSDYSVEWIYEGTSNSYKRKHGGVDHIDLNNKKQIQPKNIVIQFQRESRANDGYENNVHLIYGTTGTGKALIFQDGQVIEGKWTKATRITRSKYTDKNGKEVEFNKGQIWIETVPEGSIVKY